MTTQQEPSTLETQTGINKPRTCGDCAWYVPCRNELTGRVLPSKYGR